MKVSKQSTLSVSLASLLLLLLRAPRNHAFLVGRSVAVKHHVRPTVAVWYRDDGPDDKETTPDWIEQEKRLFDHDDWVEYRSNRNKTLDVFWTLFGLLTCYLMVVAVLL